MKTEIVKVISLLWSNLSLILGITGNSYVLCATTRHKAINLDKISIWAIQQLSVVDLANCILVLVPITTVLYADETWFLGDTW